VVEDEISVGKAGHRFTAQTGRYNLCMQLPTQEQFVDNCLAKYWFTDIPADQQWEAAHFPLPSCSGEDDTVLLWSADHTVQGLLQSVELDHQCFYHKANGKDLYNLETYYPQYLQLFAQLKSQFSRQQGKKTAELKIGIHAPGMQSKGGKIGGKIGGKKTAELKLGVHARTTEQRAADGKKGGKISGKISGKKAAELKIGCHAPGMQSAAGKIGSKITCAQQWQCLVTDHISNSGGLARYQKKRGIDTKLRVKIN